MKISRGAKPGAQKVVLYGPEGVGKSTFGSMFPAPLFLDVEGSTKHMDVTRVDPSPASWAELLDTVKQFSRERPSGFATLVLDTADWAEKMCTAHVCAKNQKDGIESFGYGKGYVYVAEEFGKLLNLLEEVIQTGYNVVILAHAKMRKFEQPDEMGAYDRWEMKLTKNVAPMVKEWADMVLFANYKTMVISRDDGKHKAQGQGKRVIYTTHHSCWDAKNRHGLPDEIPLDYGTIAHCIPFEFPADTPSATEQLENAAAPEPQPISGDIPDALRQLMGAQGVTEIEIRGVIHDANHYPGDTPWSVLQEKGYVDGWIIPNWEYITKQIEAARQNNPF